MKKATLVLDRHFTLGNMGRDMYGLFMECGSGDALRGLFYPDPDMEGTDETGFRKDWLTRLKELDPGVIRCPGGNNTATFRWKDSIGPRSERPVTVNYAHSAPGRPDLDPNQVGVDDFTQLNRLVGSECMLTLNLGMNTLQEVMEEVEYCALPAGSKWSDLRVKNGFPQPHPIGYWYLGNEVDGSWIFAQHTPDSYGHFAREAAKMIKLLCPESKVVICGTSNPGNPTYPDWDGRVLDWCWDSADMLSIHFIRNCIPTDGEQPIGLGDLGQLGVELRAFIDTTAASVRLAQTRRHSAKRMPICMDEWGQIGFPYTDERSERHERAALRPEDREELERLGLPPFFIKPNFLAHAALFGMYLTEFMNHADVLDCTCKCVMDDSLFLFGRKQLLCNTVYAVYALTSRYGRGMALRPALCTPNYQTTRYGAVPQVWASAVWNEDGYVTVFAVNVSDEEDVELACHLNGFEDCTCVSHTRLWDPNPMCGNTFAQPDRLLPQSLPVDPAATRIPLPPLSWNMLRYRVGGSYEPKA